MGLQIKVRLAWAETATATELLHGQRCRGTRKADSEWQYCAGDKSVAEALHPTQRTYTRVWWWPMCVGRRRTWTWAHDRRALGVQLTTATGPSLPPP
jgi:hypothetical protein